MAFQYKIFNTLWADSYRPKVQMTAFICKNDNTHTETHDMEITTEVKQAATCVTKGTTTYIATYESYVDSKDVQDIELDLTNHEGETEIRNAKESTSAMPGYSGDVYCISCGEKIVDGSEIPILTTTEDKEIVNTEMQTTSSETVEKETETEKEATPSIATEEETQIVTTEKEKAGSMTTEEETQNVTTEKETIASTTSEKETQTTTTEKETIASTTSEKETQTMITEKETTASTATEKETQTATTGKDIIVPTTTEREKQTVTTEKEIIVSTTTERENQTMSTETGTENEKKMHSWSEWMVMNYATCSEQGKMYRRCNDCGIFEYKSIPIEENAHVWSDEEIIIEPTIFKKGMQIRECYLCHTIEKQDIEKLNSKVVLQSKSKKLLIGETFKLKIKKKSSGDIIKSFKSSNKKVASVNKKGKVKALKKGTTVITLTMKSGCTAKCKIKVK